MAARNDLPDVTGIPSLVDCLNQSQLRLRNTVIAMVYRGDFEYAVRKLTDLLQLVCADHKFDFNREIAEGQTLGVDSVLVIFETLLAAFTQQMIELKAIDGSVVDTLHSCFRPMCSVYLWAETDSMPPLDNRVARNLLDLAIRIMPPQKESRIYSDCVSDDLKTQLMDVCLSMLQRIYMSNSRLILEATSKALAEWVHPARIDLVVLSPLYEGTLESSLRLARSYLPRVNNNDQLKLMGYLQASLIRGIVSKPDCGWALGVGAVSATQSLISAVEKSRSFKALRAFRTHEAVLLTVLDIMRVARGAYHEELLPVAHSNTPDSNSTTCSSMISSGKSSSPDQKLYHHHNLYRNQPQFHSQKHCQCQNPPYHHQAHPHCQSHGLALECPSEVFSVSHLKPFERAVALVKRENPADKRVASRLAAIDYLVSVGFLGFTVSERPHGKPYRGLVQDVKPYLPQCVEEFASLTNEYKLKLVCCCLCIAPIEYKHLVSRMHPRFALQILRVVLTTASLTRFVSVLEDYEVLFLQFVESALKAHDIEDLNTALTLLISIPCGVVPPRMLKELLVRLTTYISTHSEISDTNRKILEAYITRYVFEAGLDYSLNTLKPLIPTANPVEILKNPQLLRAPYHLLKLLAHDRRIVPIDYLKGSGILAKNVQYFRTALLLCLNLDSIAHIELALKCLELLQSDPSQSSAGRDLVSELLDSIDQELPCISVMQKRMLASLASESDLCFVPLNEAVRIALFSNYEKPFSIRVQGNLIRMRTATILLEPPALRASFYSELSNLDEELLRTVSDSLPLSSTLASDIFISITKMNASLASKETINDTQLTGSCQLHTWLLHCLEADHPFSAPELLLSEICSRAVSSLGPSSTPRDEAAVLNLVKAAAQYAAADQVPVSVSILFEKVIIMILERTWDPSNVNCLVSVLAAIFENYNEPDAEKLEHLIFHTLQLHPEEAQISVLTPLLNKNIELSLVFYDKKCVLNNVFRASVYEALTQRCQNKKVELPQQLDSDDIVTFLLDNTPIVKAMGDVCSVNEDNGVFAALLKLFKSHSKAAERRFIEITIEHEVKTARNPSDLLRSNSITMKVLLEWLNSVAGQYLSSVLAPTLSSLRCASIRDDADMESFFSDAALRFKSKALPVYVHWLLHIVNREVTPKFGAEVARQSLSVLLVLRLVCPAVIAPHQFGIARRPPARQFALILRKFAVFLHRRRETILSDMEYVDTTKMAAIYDGSTPPSLTFADQIEYLLNDKETNKINPKLDFDDEYITATRQVFHFLRTHFIEVRVLLLSNGYNDIVARMFQYLRLGRTQKIVNKIALESLRPPTKEIHTFMGESVVSVLARDFCSYQDALRKSIQALISHKEPTVIDFTDFSGFIDQWAEQILNLAFSTSDSNTEYRVVKRWCLRAINCPRRIFAVIHRLRKLISLNMEIRYYTSVDFAEISEVPSNLTQFQSAIKDIQEAVKFEVEVRSGHAIVPYATDLYVGAKFLQFISESSCDVIPYVPQSKESSLTFRMTLEDLHITYLGIDFTVLRPSFSLLRVLELSLIAAESDKNGVILDLRKGIGYNLTPKGKKSSDLHDLNLKQNPSSKPAVGPLSHDVTHKCFDRKTAENTVIDVICPGRLLFCALDDSLHEIADVRRRAIEMYALLPDAIGLQLSILSPQQCPTPNQICLLSETAAKSHPELACCVVSTFAMLRTDITERAAQIVSVWIPLLEANNACSSILMRDRILRPLLQAVVDSPDRVGPILLEYFWPQLKDIPVLSADIMMELAMNASDRSLESLRQIVANGISLNRPHESREMAETLLANLHSKLLTKDFSATRWSQHPEWHEINVSLILFGSVSVDSETAEVLFSEVSFLLLVFAGVGSGRLRRSLYLLLVNYLNAFLQSTTISIGQRKRLHLVRAELLGPRGAALFGVNGDPQDDIPDWESDDYTEYSAEMIENLGRILSDIMAAVFSSHLLGYQETRVAIFSKIMEFIVMDWPPLQRRCVLACIGAVRILMPDSVASDLIMHLGQVLANDNETALPTRGVLVSSYLRMFSEVIDCIPGSGAFHQYLFWLSVISLATGCKVIKDSALRLLSESIKIAHFRGVFREKSMSEFYLETASQWLGNEEGSGSLWPLDIPSTEANFHITLAQLLVSPLQEPESQALALTCCEVLSTACPNEFVYSSFLYLCGEEGMIASRAPTGAFLDTDDAVLRWLASRVQFSHPSSVMALALCAECTGFSRSVNFSQKGPRLLSLVQAIKDRRVINIISPLLRNTFIRLLDLDDSKITVGLKTWTSNIFSRSSKERRSIASDANALMDMANQMKLRPWFNHAYKLHPLFFEEQFTETTRSTLASINWIQQYRKLISEKASLNDNNSSQHSFETEKLL